MRLNIKFIFGLLVFTTLACSTTEKTVETPVQYSEQTEKAFNSIETDEAQLLERYRQMRMQNWDKYIKKKNSVPSAAADYARRRQKENAQHSNNVKDQKVPPPPPPELSEEQLKAIEVEINQRKSIFCMKAKTVNRFDSEADCQAFVENNHFECLKQFGEKSKSLVSCMRGKLK